MKAEASIFPFLAMIVRNHVPQLAQPALLPAETLVDDVFGRLRRQLLRGDPPHPKQGRDQSLHRPVIRPLPSTPRWFFSPRACL